jgi:hypothetical protein
MNRKVRFFWLLRPSSKEAAFAPQFSHDGLIEKVYISL